MATILTAATEAQLNADIAAADAAATGSFVIDFLADITETTDLAAIELHPGVTLTVNGGDANGGSYTLDGADSYNGFSIDADAVAIVENLDISNIPPPQPAVLSSGTLAGTVSISSGATVDQTAAVTFGTTGNPATVINQGTYEIDQFTAGTNGPAINGVTESLFVNTGTLVKLANAGDASGISEFYVDVTDTGTISVTDADSNLRFDGASNSFSGVYIGGGMVDYGDPATFDTVGNGSYCIVTLGNVDMSQGACTTTWADVNQNGSVTASSTTTITNYGTWNFTSDNGLTLEDPADASSSISEFTLNNTATLEKTGGTGTTVIGIDLDEYGDASSNDQGFIYIAIGTLAFNGLLNNFYSVISGAGTFSIGGGGANFLFNGTAISTSGWTITGAGTDVTVDVPLDYSGAFTEQSGATLTLTSSNLLTLSNATFDGTVTGGSSAGIVLGSGALLQIDDLASVVNGSQVQNFNAPIRGLAGGDIIRLEGFGKFATINGASSKYSSSTNSTSLTLTDNGSTVATLDLAGGNYTTATVTADPVVNGAVDVTLPGGTTPPPVISAMSDPIGSIGVTGTAEAGNLVSLFDGTTLVGTTTAGANGSWSIAVATSLPQGTDNLTATAENQAAITSASSAPATYLAGIPAGYTSATLGTPLVFGNGNNVVADASQLETLDFGDGNNVVSATGQSKTLEFGSGTDQIDIASTAIGNWQQNQVSIDGSSGVNAEGNWNQVMVGSNGGGGATVFNGSNNFFEALGTAGYTASDEPGSSSDEFYLYGGNANLVLAGTGDMAFISGQATANITDNGSGLQLYVGAGAGDITINGWANDPNAGIQLLDYTGFQTAQAALNALVSDGHGGMLLPLLNSGTSIDFANTASGSINVNQLAVPSPWSGGFSGNG
jgi:large repetitive protein